MVKVVSGRPVVAKARFRHDINQCEICGEQSDNDTGLSPSTCGFHSQYKSTNVQ